MPLQNAPSHVRPWALFLSIALGGAALLFGSLYVESQIHNGFWHAAAQFGEHLASALIVAGIMGLTYESAIHARTIGAFERLNQQQNEIFHELIEQQNDFIGQALINVVSEIESIRTTVEALRAEEVFKQLIHNMAEKREKIPTIYSPPRDIDDEFVFSTNHDFFRRLIANRTDRESVVKILHDWLAPGMNAKFRFLASDFVGLLRLHELAPELRKRFEEKKPAWNTLTDQREKSCLLNYAWAASRCEDQPYRYLKYLLRTMPPDVQEWILFIPRQMQEPELCTMIDEYLGTKAATVSDKLLELTIDAIAALHSQGLIEVSVEIAAVARKHRAMFDTRGLAQRLDEAIGD
jgi:hypothetical protein